MAKKQKFEAVYKLDEYGKQVAFIKDFDTKKAAEQYIVEKITEFGRFSIVTTYR